MAITPTNWLGKQSPAQSSNDCAESDHQGVHVKFGRIGIILIGIAGIISMPSCTSISPPAQPVVASTVKAGSAPDLDEIYANLEKAGGKAFKLDPAASSVRIYAFRAGPAARLGHNHVLSAPQFKGYYHLPAAGPSSGRFDLEFRLDQLEIDNESYRSKLGIAFASKLSQDAIDGTRDHMLGEDNLQADRFPFVRVHSVEISGEATRFAARVQIEMHGQTREMWIPLSVEGLPDHLEVAGSFVMRQTDFGAQPYSVMGGLIAVRDEVVIEFKLTGN